MIDSLARPGGNVTGVIDILPDLAGKRLELLKEIFPKLSRVAHLSSASSISGQAHLKETEAVARALGVRVQALAVRGPGDLESAFRAAAEGGAEALIVVGVSFFIPHRQRIVNLEIKNRFAGDAYPRTVGACGRPHKLHNRCRRAEPPRGPLRG